MREHVGVRDIAKSHVFVFAEIHVPVSPILISRENRAISKDGGNTEMAEAINYEKSIRVRCAKCELSREGRRIRGRIRQDVSRAQLEISRARTRNDINIESLVRV